MLTMKQNQVYQFIRSYIQQHQHSPTVEEIAEGIGIRSRGVAYRYLKALTKAKVIELIPNRRRNIRLPIDKSDPSLAASIPILGKIAAGQPIEAITQNEAIELSDIFVGPDRYALQVVGDSMIEEGIFDGDIVICQQSEQARHGQIVVAVIDQEHATLKRLHYHPNQQIALLPANLNHTPQIYDADRVSIQGIFIGLLRICPS